MLDCHESHANELSLGESNDNSKATANGASLACRAMGIGARIEQRRKLVGISQAELARRVGVRQSTLHSLISGKSRSTRSMRELARELGTTLEYLMGETDDPDEGAAPPPELDFADRELLESFHILAIDDQRALLQIVRSMAGRAKAPTLHAPTSGYRGEAD